MTFTSFQPDSNKSQEQECDSLWTESQKAQDNRKTVIVSLDLYYVLCALNKNMTYTIWTWT